MARGMPSGMQVWTGSSPEPPLATSARLASNLAWYSGVRGASWPRAGGLVESKTPSGPTLCHWPAIGGYLLSSNGCWAAAGPEIIAAANATAPVTLRNMLLLPCGIGAASPNDTSVPPTQMRRQQLTVPLAIPSPACGGGQGRGPTPRHGLVCKSPLPNPPPQAGRETRPPILGARSGGR